MKKTIQYALLAVGALGVLALSNQLSAENNAMPSMSCCSGMTLATPMSDTDTNTVPDLLKTCPVSGEKLGGDMGKPYVFAYKGQEVKLCCSMCKKDFDKDPEKFIAKIRAADKK